MATEFTFLMCSERSGSNLITRMFDAHPRCCGPTPTHVVRLLAENRSRYGDLADDVEWRRLLDDTADLLATKIGVWATDWSSEKLATLPCERDLGALLRHVFRAEARANGKRRLFIKENHLHRYLPFLQNAFADLKIVAMVRDPRDMVLSWKNSPILRGDVVRAARIWRDDQDHLVRLLGYLEPGRDIHLVTYEDLVGDPEAELARACGFLQLTPDPAMLQHHRQPGARSLADGSDVWKNLARPVMGDNVAKWRDGLSTTEAAYVEKLCAESMSVLGYAPETRDDRSLDELEAELQPHERHEKPGWADVSADEKRLRGAREDVVRRITSAPLIPRAGEVAHA